MTNIDDFIGTGTDLTTTQMVIRGFIVFSLALVMIRLAGRRSFGIGTPFDRVVTILLGAILSRAVAGASPFVPTLVTCASLVILHRLAGWLVCRSHRISKWIEGEKIMLFSNGKFLKENHKRALVREEDVYQGVRKALQTEDLTTVDKVYMERNGEVCVIKKS